MTARQYVAIIYGAAALGMTIFAHVLPGVAGAHELTAAHVAAISPDPAGLPAALSEIAPGWTGHAEHDDLPAYLTAGPTPGDHADG